MMNAGIGVSRKMTLQRMLGDVLSEITAGFKRLFVTGLCAASRKKTGYQKKYENNGDFFYHNFSLFVMFN